MLFMEFAAAVIISSAALTVFIITALRVKTSYDGLKSRKFK